MELIHVMVNGAPGNMARQLMRHVIAAGDMNLIPMSMTGPETAEKEIAADGVSVRLIRPDEKDLLLDRLDTSGLAADGAKGSPVVAVDFTHPSAVNANAAFYAANGLWFVMGTTGGDRSALHETVEDSEISAVIAPNMAKQIVGLQAMLEYGAATFPGLFRGFDLRIRESHQRGKADTSGTAKALMASFQRLGCEFSADQIEMERDPVRQREEWGIPEEFLDGHAWHTYTLRSPASGAEFAITHNINGREIYMGGILDAVRYLAARRTAGPGKVYSMEDVLRAG
ncbi:MAG: dihydrodipicolinate reductase [Desulfococcus sp.]|nr:MAG: dihydrodipicolinate reductase [Desulfococcus sp.]